MRYKTLIAVLLCALLTLSACGAKESVSRITEQSIDEEIIVSDTSSDDVSAKNSESLALSEKNGKKADRLSASPETDTKSSKKELTSETENESNVSKNSDTDSKQSDSDASDTESEKFDSKHMTPVCRSALVYCIDDDKMLYEDSVDDTVAPASLTKLLTASVVLNNMSANDVVTVGTEQYLISPDSSLCYLEMGNELTVYDLLTGMLLCSGNDAAYTAAVSTARAVNPDLSDSEAVELFVEMMNELASEIGMNNSHFAVPDGIDSADQYTTASDLVKLAKYALDIPEIREIVGTDQANVNIESGESFYWINTNQLLDPNSTYYSEDVIGMKTGTTESAGACLIAAAEKNNKTYITVVTGCYADTDRFELTAKLLDLFCK